jgi:PAS domain S-box-containing protein
MSRKDDIGGEEQIGRPKERRIVICGPGYIPAWGLFFLEYTRATIMVPGLYPVGSCRCAVRSSHYPRINSGSPGDISCVMRDLQKWLNVVIVLALIAGAASTWWTIHAEREYLQEQLLTEARLVSGGIDISHVKDLTWSEADVSTPGYQHLKEYITLERDATPLRRFVYLMGHRPDGTIVVLVDSESPDSPDYSPPGQEYPEASDTLRSVFSLGKESFEGPLSDRWGTWTSGLVPFTDPSTGEVIAVLGIDFDAKDWGRQIIIAATIPILLTALVVALLIALLILLNRKEREEERLAASSAKLQESEDRFHFVISHLPGSIWAVDTHLVFILFQGNFLAMIGLTQDQVIGKDLDEFFRTTDFHHTVIEAHNKALNGETVAYSMEYQGIFLESVVAPIFTGKDIVSGVVGIAFDVTEIQQAREKLLVSERKYKNLYCYAQVGLYEIGLADGGIMACNQRFCELFGFSSVEGALGRDIFPSYIEPAVWDTIKKKIREEGSIRDYVVRFKNLITQEIFWGELSARIDPELDIAEGSIVDITDRIQMEDALRRSNEKLNLLSSITRHDINNQLFAMQGYLGLLQEEVTDPVLRDHIIQVADATGRISEMIRFTKMYENIGVYAPTWQFVHLLVDSTAREFSNKDLFVENLVPSGLSIYADSLISKVFYNLIENSIRYGDESTEVRVYLKEYSQDRVIICEDNGKGISIDEKEKIFRRGYGKNTGFGLFLAREILAITGITIKETGEPGRGARFEITVPEGKWRRG